MSTIRFLEQEPVGLSFPDSDSTEPRLLAETEDKVYQFFSTPRRNPDNNLVENYYEIYNTNTGVVESRIRSNYVMAVSMFETIVDVYYEYKQAGSAKAMDAQTEASESITH